MKEFERLGIRERYFIVILFEYQYDPIGFDLKLKALIRWVNFRQILKQLQTKGYVHIVNYQTEFKDLYVGNTRIFVYGNGKYRKLIGLTEKAKTNIDSIRNGLRELEIKQDKRLMKKYSVTA